VPSMCNAVGIAASGATQRWIGWKVMSLLARHRRKLAALSLLILVAAGLDLAIPFVTRGVIDQIVRAMRSAEQASFGALIRAGITILVATTATRLLRSFYNYQLFRTVSHCEDEVKNAAFANFLALDTEYHTAVNTGEVVGALDRGATALFVVLYEVLGQNLIPPLMVVLGVLISLVTKDSWIAMIVFLPLPAYVLAVWRVGSRMDDIERKVARAFETVTKESYDIASNVRSVKKFSHDKQEAMRQRKLLYAARDLHYRGERLWALIENVQTFMATAGRVGVITLGGYFVFKHRCTVGDYVLFIAMQDMVYGPISQLSVILPKLRRNLSRAERLFEILEQGRSIRDLPGAQELRGVQHSVEFRNVSFRYARADRWALRNVSFSVPAGSVVALIGPSGSGKSTLMNLLQRLYEPESGSILLDGKNIREFTQHSLREHVAVVPQEVELFSRTILENVGYGREGVTHTEVEHAAHMAQAHSFIQRCDRAYQTQVGERGLKLSGGERQRLGIARALVHDPQILILDEATSHLDNESERLIQVAFEQLIRGRTCFVIAHRLSTIRNADMVVVFCDGGIEAAGTHEELWNTSPTYRKLHSLHIAEKPKLAKPDEIEEGLEVLSQAAGD
jgi:ABC-type multidrug transport system fused ATPase/permease subunit